MLVNAPIKTLLINPGISPAIKKVSKSSDKPKFSATTISLKNPIPLTTIVKIPTIAIFLIVAFFNTELVICFIENLMM
jgi:hypothetical protein